MVCVSCVLCVHLNQVKLIGPDFAGNGYRDSAERSRYPSLACSHSIACPRLSLALGLGLGLGLGLAVAVAAALSARTQSLSSDREHFGTCTRAQSASPGPPPKSSGANRFQVLLLSATKLVCPTSSVAAAQSGAVNHGLASSGLGLIDSQAERLSASAIWTRSISMPLGCGGGGGGGATQAMRMIHKPDCVMSSATEDASSSSTVRAKY